MVVDPEGPNVLGASCLAGEEGRACAPESHQTLASSKGEGETDVLQPLGRVPWVLGRALLLGTVQGTGNKVSVKGNQGRGSSEEQ